MRVAQESFLTETPYSRMKILGVGAVSLVDLLALGIAESEADLDRAEQIARKLAPTLRKLRGLADLDQKELEANGVHGFAAARCMALIELGRRLNNALKGPGTSINGAEDVYQLLDHLRYQKQESFVAILLDSQNVVQRVETVHIGTLTASIVGPREVFRAAIKEGASSLIVAHNHPSGDPSPSPEDIELTRLLVDLGKKLDIPVLDHIIIGEHQFRSLREGGFIK